MHKPSVVRLVRSSVIQALVLALAVLSLHTTKAFAATDWSGIQTAMGADGAVFPGDVLRFQLVRKEISYSINGTPVNGVFIGAWTSGFVAFKEEHDGKFYVSGSLPAQDSELSALQDALLKHPQIQITAIYSHDYSISPNLVWVHIEATGNGEKLATWIASALETIHNPQLDVGFIPGTNSVFDPAEILPPQYLAIYKEGFFAQVDDFFAFWLPRPDEKKITLDNNVKAETGLGVGQTFYIMIPELNGGAGNAATINVDFALRADELPAVQSILRAGGFTLPSQSTNYVSANHTLYYLHASGSGDGFTLGEALYKAIKVIEQNSSKRGN